MAHQQIHPKSHPHSQGICFGGEWTLKLLILLLIGWKLGKEVFHVFTMRFLQVPNNSRWNSNKYAPIPIRVHAASALGENRLPRH